MIRVVFDMETGDPDDFLTLALLGGHPDVELLGVTVTPGTPHQIGVVRYGLERLGLDVPVGSFDLEHRKARGTPDEHYVTCVSAWHHRTFGDITPSTDAKKFHDPLAACCAIDPTIATWAEVEVFRQKGEWGARLAQGSGVRIIVDLDSERFVEVLTRSGP